MTKAISPRILDHLNKDEVTAAQKAAADYTRAVMARGAYEHKVVEDIFLKHERYLNEQRKNR